MTASDATTWLPSVNATLNGLSALFILAGWWFIKHERKLAHIASMVAALTTSTLFLACYLTYHWLKAGHVTKFAHDGWPRDVYIPLLTSHTILAVAVLPMIICTVIPALRARYDKHKRIARWTLPVWLYVSVTGVLVYFWLYQWFPGPVQ
ncbi:MAG: DUF420 domain-containing protein [Chthoniobacterales bacterium]